MKTGEPFLATVTTAFHQLGGAVETIKMEQISLQLFDAETENLLYIVAITGHVPADPVAEGASHDIGVAAAARFHQSVSGRRHFQEKCFPHNVIDANVQARLYS